MYSDVVSVLYGSIILYSDIVDSDVSRNIIDIVKPYGDCFVLMVVLGDGMVKKLLLKN